MTTATAEQVEEQTREQVEITVPARAAAIGWLNGFLAASQDEGRTVLYRTLSVEFFDGGVQIIGCDGTALFRAWVPVEPGIPWPAWREAPARAVVVMDPDGFGLGFMRALARITNEDGHAHETLHIATAPQDDEATLALGSEFMTERLTLRACGQRIDLRLFDGPYVGWRQIRLGVDETERVEGMVVATRLLALVGKLKGVTSVDLTFHGEQRRVGFVAGGDAEVRGFIMPMTRTATVGRAED